MHAFIIYSQSCHSKPVWLSIAEWPMTFGMMWPLVSNLFKCQSTNCSKTRALSPPWNPRESWCPLSLFSSLFHFLIGCPSCPFFRKGIQVCRLLSQRSSIMHKRPEPLYLEDRREQQFWANSAHLFTSLGRHEATEARGKVAHTYTQKDSRHRGWTAVEHIMLCKVVHAEWIGCRDCALHTKTIRRNRLQSVCWSPSPQICFSHAHESWTIETRDLGFFASWQGMTVESNWKSVGCTNQHEVPLGEWVNAWRTADAKFGDAHGQNLAKEATLYVKTWNEWTAKVSVAGEHSKVCWGL